MGQPAIAGGDQDEIVIEFEPVVKDPRRRMDIKAGDLVIDQNLQRPVDRSRVERIAAEWDWRLVETLTVAHVGKGVYKVIEGQYRTLAAQLRSPDTLLPCVVLDKVPDKEQAELALTISSGRKPMVSVDRFKQRVSGGDPAAIAAFNVLAMHGLRIGASLSGRTIIAAQAIMSITDDMGEDLDVGADILNIVIKTLMDAYKDGESSAKERWRAPLITGLAKLVQANYNVYDADDMAERMAEHPAIYWTNLTKGTRAKRPEDVVAAALKDAYNRGKRQNRRLI